MYASKSNGDSFRDFIHDASEDMVALGTNDMGEKLSETKMRNRLIEHLRYTDTMAAKDDIQIFILYPFPRIHIIRKGKLSVRNLGGKKRKRKFTQKRKL